MTMQFRRGLDSDLPTNPANGEPLVALDTKKFYIGINGSPVLINGIDSSGIQILLDSSIDSFGSNLLSEDLDMQGNRVLFSNVYDSAGSFPDPSVYHGMFAHAHDDGTAHFSHAGGWIELARSMDLAASTIDSAESIRLTIDTVDSDYVQARVNPAMESDPLIKSSDFTGVAGTRYYIDTTIRTVELSLPTSPEVGDQIGFVDYTGNFKTTSASLGRNGNNIMGLAENMTLDVDYFSGTVEFINTTQGWKLI